MQSESASDSDSESISRAAISAAKSFGLAAALLVVVAGIAVQLCAGPDQRVGANAYTCWKPVT
jgi:hypothetical protein